MYIPGEIELVLVQFCGHDGGVGGVGGVGVARLYAGALGGARGSAVLGGGRVHRWWVRVRISMCIDRESIAVFRRMGAWCADVGGCGGGGDCRVQRFGGASCSASKLALPF